DRRARRRAVVDAVMRPEVVQQRMEAAVGESRRDAGELQRRAEELLAERRSGARVIAGVSVGRFVAEGLVRLAVVREARGGDGAVAGEIAAGEAPFDHDAEGIAFLQGE